MKFWLQNIDNKTFSPAVDGIFYPGVFVKDLPDEPVIGSFCRWHGQWKIVLDKREFLW